MAQPHQLLFAIRPCFSCTSVACLPVCSASAADLRDTAGHLVGSRRCFGNIAGDLRRRRALFLNRRSYGASDGIYLVDRLLDPYNGGDRDPGAHCAPDRCAGRSPGWIARSGWLVAFTSEATTAKPLPASPARAAPIVAFRASRLVLAAISPIMSATAPIRPTCSFSASMVARVSAPAATARPTIAVDWATWAPISWIEALSSSAALATVCALANACAEASAALCAESVGVVGRGAHALRCRRHGGGAITDLVQGRGRLSLNSVGHAGKCCVLAWSPHAAAAAPVQFVTVRFRPYYP